MWKQASPLEGSTMKSPMYEKDFLRWTEQQVAALRAGKLADIDAESLLEELEDMGNERKEALQSLIRMVIIHLLKLQYSTASDPRAGWKDEVGEFRDQIETKLDNTPSLNHFINALFQNAWKQARKRAVNSLKEHGEFVEIPTDCPYSLEQVLNEDFFP